MANDPAADVPETQQPHAGDDGRKSDNPAHRHSARHWGVFILLVVVAAVLVVLLGWLPRHKREEIIDRQAKERTEALPRVEVVRIERAPSTDQLMIPGTSQAYTEAYIYARASGYLSKRLVDIGDRVHAGQLLATVDAPDLDKQVAQARSTLRQSESSLVQMQAQLYLAKVTWDRYKVLVAKGVFSRQDGDTQEANFRVGEANVRATENTVQANKDNLDRLLVLQQYERVTAPFSGIITARNVDMGSLITAAGGGLGTSSEAVSGTTQAAAQGNNSGAQGLSANVTPSTGGAQGGQLFSIASIDPLRVLVSIPEAYTNAVQVGQRAELLFEGSSNQKFDGRVTRTSSSIDQNTRTLLVEIQVPNHNGRLLPGMYVIANLVQAKATPPLLVPGESIVVRNARNVVALVDENCAVHFQPIVIGRDYGNETEVISGLKPGDIVARSVSDEVQDGVRIQPQFVHTPPPGSPAGSVKR
ncbi:MAG: efflux RND transporter periplasmic adaptor subunit [Acidobacteriaceae bacterium]|nr:efflux RND transporter periplasmic adaptor subunit [Acidobacteriaceae bacterium]